MSARLVGLTVLVSACGAPGDEPLLAPAEARGALIGGREASLAEWPATVLINDGCTGAKVGPRLFITAAHCVHDTQRNTVPVGGAVRVTTKRAQVHGEDYLSLELLNIHVMQGWLDACQAPCGVNVLAASHPSDIALFEVGTDSPGITEAYVDISPVVPGDALVEVGYGCEDGYGLPFDYANRRLKVEGVVALPPERLLHEGSFVGAGDEGNIAASYVITPGFGQEHGASLCPGDSGGPLYRDDATQRLVVGINAYYTFPPGSGVATTNWHTRVDDESRYGVASWLEQRGVNLVDGCLPICDGKLCGDDGCGGSCGSCAENEACTAEGQCMCVPSCAGKTCGDDGCGGSCGECEADAAVPEPTPDAGADPAPPAGEDEDASDTETNLDEATAGEGDFCADHPGTPECAVPVTGKGCQLKSGTRKGEGAAYLLLFALPMLWRRWRRPSRAATLGS